MVCDPLIFYFGGPNHISGADKTSYQILKFCIQVRYIKYKPNDNKLPQTGMVRVTWPIFKLWLSSYFGMGKDRHFKFGVLIDIDE